MLRGWPRGPPAARSAATAQAVAARRPADRPGDPGDRARPACRRPTAASRGSDTDIARLRSYCRLLGGKGATEQP
eukprot:13110134-Alexandrium_andersonii.AAC.1